MRINVFFLLTQRFVPLQPRSSLTDTAVFGQVTYGVILSSAPILGRHLRCATREQFCIVFLYNIFNNKPSSAATPKEFRSLLRLMVCDSARRWAIISFGGWRAAHGILPSGALNRCHGRR